MILVENTFGSYEKSATTKATVAGNSRQLTTNFGCSSDLIFLYGYRE